MPKVENVDIHVVSTRELGFDMSSHDNLSAAFHVRVAATRYGLYQTLPQFVCQYKKNEG